MKKLIVALSLVITSGAAFAIFGSLVGEEINGSLKYCKYSNGVIITIPSYKLCPVSIN